MKRLLIFPPLFAVWFFAAQAGLMSLSWAWVWLEFRFVRPNTDFYWHDPIISIANFIPGMAVGAVTGCVFAALDFIWHRQSRSATETALILSRNLLRSGVVAVILVLLCQVSWRALLSHKRYHAYPPDMAWSIWVSNAQCFFLLASVLWAAIKTLRWHRPAERVSSSQ